MAAPPAGSGVVGKISRVLKDPAGFFKGAQSEAGIGPAFRYLALLLLIPTVIFGILSIVAPSLAVLQGAEFLAGLGILIAVFIYVGGLVGSFIGAAILHIFGLLLGVKKGYAATYKAMVYGDTPALLLGWIPLIGLLFGLWSLYLTIKGLSVLHEISMGRALAIIILPAIIVVALVLLLLFLVVFPSF